MTGKFEVCFRTSHDLSFWQDVSVLPSVGHIVIFAHGRRYVVVEVVHDYVTDNITVKLELELCIL